MKAIRSLPEGEQDSVLAYLLDRAVMTEPARGSVAETRLPPPLGSGFSQTTMEISAAPLPQWAAWLILRRLGDGVTVDQLTSELRLDPDVLRTALHDLAGRAHSSERLAEIFRELAEGSTIAQAAANLGLTEEVVSSELEPTERLAAGLCAALMARAALPRPPSGQLGGGAQGPLRTMPVRFPEQQYERLKDWSEQHNFPMAVVVRGVVERFLDAQHRASS